MKTILPFDESPWNLIVVMQQSKTVIAIQILNIGYSISYPSIVSDDVIDCRYRIRWFIPASSALHVKPQIANNNYRDQNINAVSRAECLSSRRNAMWCDSQSTFVVHLFAGRRSREGIHLLDRSWAKSFKLSMEYLYFGRQSENRDIITK